MALLKREAAGKARLKFTMEVVQARDGTPVLRGHTTHAIVDKSGKPIRPPAWLTEALGEIAD